jgi:hypothetical protein
LAAQFGKTLPAPSDLPLARLNNAPAEPAAKQAWSREQLIDRVSDNFEHDMIIA